ncbi:MAG TPA: hypothetical protein VGC77_11855 [Rhodopseudomonas sp.]|uniref:hypothetical protein n=1 Tax=Rhodopseudomonas sp. TaxID=1078 RepID=UPI002EDB9D28
MFSTVLAKPGSSKVIKVNTRPDDWLDYALWATRKGYAGKLSPRIYSYQRNSDGTYIAVMERMARTMCAERSDKTSRWGNNWPALAFGLRAYGALRDQQITDEMIPGGRAFVQDVQENFEYLDLHDENIMVRFDGTVCITDPVSSTNQVFNTSNPPRMRSRELEAINAGAN